MEYMDAEKASERVKSFISRARDAANKKNYKYAIDMYVTALKHEPTMLEIRRDLRNIEMENISYKASMFRQKKALLIGMMDLNKGKTAVKNEEYFEAMAYAEGVLASDPTVGPALTLLANAAEAAGMDLIAMDALEIYGRFHEKDLEAQHNLCELYSENGMGPKAIALCQRLQAANPENGQIEGWLKNYMANSAMDAGGIGAKGKANTTSTAAKTETNTGGPTRGQSASSEAVDSLIIQVEASPEDLNLRKKLGRLLHKSEMYDEAVEHLEKAVQLGANDPNTVKLFNSAYVSSLDNAIKAWEAYAEENPGDAAREAEESIASLKKQRAEFRLHSARERVLHYGNDPGAHFELAEILYETEEFDEAISELKQSELSPRYQKKATLLKGTCYRLVKNYSSAVEAFEEIGEAFAEGSKEFLQTKFELALTYEEQGDTTQATTFYDIVREYDPSFRGVQNKTF